MRRSVQRAEFVQRRFDADGVGLSYVEGPNNGRPLVLFPGQTMPWQSYERVLPMLAERFHVFACDVHGHGASDFTPDRYSFVRIGQDFAGFLECVVGRPALISGNSSGGVIAVWLAANVPEWVCGVMPEDPPLLTCEWPRLKSCYVYSLLEHAVATLADPETRDVPAFFAGFEIPDDGVSKVTAAAGPLFNVISGYIRLMQWIHPGRREVSLPGAPFVLNMAVRGFSSYDPEFSRPFLDGAFGEGFDHAETLGRIECPMLLLHANWFENERYGLVGAMTDDDVARVRDLVTHCRYERVTSGHVVHQENPKVFVRHAEALDEWVNERAKRNLSTDAVRHGT